MIAERRHYSIEHYESVENIVEISVNTGAFPILFMDVGYYTTVNLIKEEEVVELIREHETDKVKFY